MSYLLEKSTGDLVISGFENGISSSPHQGLANLQNVNISTETGEVMCSFNRVRQSQVSATGTFTQTSATTVSVSGVVLKPGTWIRMTSTGIANLTNGSYYYVVAIAGVISLSATFTQDNSTIVGSLGAGSATFSVQSMSKPLIPTTEPYIDSSGNPQYRYYILDDLANVWVHDTATLTGIDTPVWFAPQKQITLAGRIPSGLAVLNGWLTICLGIGIYWKPTCQLGRNFINSGAAGLPGLLMSGGFHSTLNGHQGKLYWTDKNFIASLFPNSSLITGAVNIQSYCSYSSPTSADDTIGLITDLIGGSYPYIDSTIRVPVMLFTSGALATAIHPDFVTSWMSDTIYYLQASFIISTGQVIFSLYAAATGGAALDITTGATGIQYFNTFNPIIQVASATYTFTPQRLNLPTFETAQCLAELGNTVVIGCAGNVLYPWDQISPLPSDLIPLPESDTHTMITVNNMLYVFAGHKGNVYLTNGSSASLATTVPDYTAGIAGTPFSYIEPYFSWGGAMYCRGRVYFSILDQTATKAGNCGGIWSFVPTQNFYIGQNTGLALRLENQNSYGTYNGYAPVLISSNVQTAIAPQYWAGWQSTYTGGTYGIDFTDTVPVTTAIIETDLIPTGTLLVKQTFQQLEYKLASPLAVGESIAMNYRLNGTDAWATCGTAIVESTTALSGYFEINFQNTQWTQLQIIENSLGTASSSFVRLNEIRIR